MNLKPSILTAIQKMWYETATPIQEEVITHFISGQHIVGQSQTGTGKTAAFVIPLLNAVNPKERNVQVLVLCPTRELAVQTEEEFYKLSWGTIWVKTCVAYGWSNIFRQKEKIMQGAQVVIATPGRAIDMIQRKFLKLHNVKYLVLDEADRMLDMGFSEDVEYIRSQCTNMKQLMSFSATVTHELKDMLDKYIWSDYHHITIAKEAVSEKINHMFIKIPRDQKVETLDTYLDEHKDQKILIFTQTKIGTDELVDQLHRSGHSAFAIHGDIKQRDRNNTIKAFKDNKAKILVATDVASRGLNLNQIDLVINRDVPQDPESYIHRIGRTGRAGAEGKAITLATAGEMKYLYAIEKRNKIVIKEVDIHGNEIERPQGGNMRSSSFGKYGGSSRGGSRGGYGWRNWSWGWYSWRSSWGGYGNRGWSDNRRRYGSDPRPGELGSRDYNPGSSFHTPIGGWEQKWYKQERQERTRSFDSRKSFGGRSADGQSDRTNRPARSGDRSTGTMGRHNDNAGFKPRGRSSRRGA